MERFSGRDLHHCADRYLSYIAAEHIKKYGLFNSLGITTMNEFISLITVGDLAELMNEEQEELETSLLEEGEEYEPIDFSQSSKKDMIKYLKKEDNMISFRVFVKELMEYTIPIKMEYYEEISPFDYITGKKSVVRLINDMMERNFLHDADWDEFLKCLRIRARKPGFPPRGVQAWRRRRRAAGYA